MSGQTIESASAQAPRSVLVAVAIDDHGRYVFVSVDRVHFDRVTHFPGSVDEALELLSFAPGPPGSHEQLLAAYNGAVVLGPIVDRAG